VFRIGIESVVAARAVHSVRGSGGIDDQVHSSGVGFLIWKPPVLALVDGATASATRQVAVRVRSRMCHSEALKPSVLLLLPFRGTLFLQRFLGFLLPLTLTVQTLAHGSLP
jgi:hypothetical protein